MKNRFRMHITIRTQKHTPKRPTVNSDMTEMERDTKHTYLMAQRHNAAPRAWNNTAQLLIACSMLYVMSGIAPAHAQSYPGDKRPASGTVLNAVPTQTTAQAPGAPAAANYSASSIGNAIGQIGSLFSSSNEATAPSAPQQAVANAPAVAAPNNTIPAAEPVIAHDLGEPDSSPAMYAARTEIDAPAPQAEITPAAPAATAQATVQPVAPAVEQHTEIQPVANHVTASVQTDAALGTPDDSPSKFEERRELIPVKNESKITNVLTSLMKPVSGEDAKVTTAQDGSEVTPLATYDSPGIVIKKESLSQQSFQPELTDKERQMAAMNPAAGEPNNNAPLIQLPDVPPPVVPSKADELKPATQAKTDESEPVKQLSPATKAIAKKIPAGLDAPEAKKSSEPVAVDRAKSSQTPEGSVATSVKHEEMGIKIEVKAPSMDMNYELEKAYNATASGQSETAMAIYKSILANDPDNKSALFGLGTLYHRAGQLDAARKLYSKLLSLEPNHRDALNNFLVLMSDEAPEAALAQLSALEKRDPKFSPIPAQMAIIYQKMGDMDKASEKMFRAIDLAPENLVYRYNLAIMLDKQQKYDEAGKLYRQIVQAYQRGEATPGNIQQIQQRLTFISSNRN
jgi:Tfp pilus assembly protein PilF